MYQAIDLTDPNVIENLSDGNHTFAELYHHRHLLWLSMLSRQRYRVDQQETR